MKKKNRSPSFQEQAGRKSPYHRKDLREGVRKNSAAGRRKLLNRM